MLQPVLFALFSAALFDCGFASTVEYPNPRRDESAVENLHGVQITDPYRWMEDPDNEETKKFVQEENAISNSFIDKSAFHADITQRLTQMMDHADYTCPMQRGGKYYFQKNSGLQNQDVFYVQNTLDDQPQVFFDPNTLSEDGTVGVQMTSFSEDGQIFAYGLSASGSDWFTLHFKHVTEGDCKYPEELEKLKFTPLAWTHDNKGFFYAGYNDQEGNCDGSEATSTEGQKVYYHFMGTEQKNDILVVDFSDTKLLIFPIVSDCGKYLIIQSQHGATENRIHISDLSRVNYEIKNKLEIIPIVSEEDATIEYVTNTDSVAVFRTNKDAPNFKLVLIDFNNPHPKNWRDLVAGNDKDALEWAQIANEKYLVLCYIHDVKHVLQVHKLETGEKIHDIPMETGQIREYDGKRTNTALFYVFQSFLIPTIVYYLDLSKEPFETKVFAEVKVANFDPTRFTVEQIFYASKDGTQVPMHILYKKDLKKDGNNPCLIYGYGGFGISTLPKFNPSRVLFMDNLNGVYAVANIRGGGEYGDAWRRGGNLANKQNSFDDFQAAAEYLIREKYTNAGMMVSYGASNGGLLTAVCANQRPDLYKAVIVNVGVLDMLRFHKFTIGRAWITDYGNPGDEKDFQVLLKYSPLHNIRVPQDEKVQYPNVLLLTGDHDDRVSPLHSLKFVAQLQFTFTSVERQTNVLMIRVDTDSGHGTAKPTTKMIEEAANWLSFACQTMGLTFNKS